MALTDCTKKLCEQYKNLPEKEQQKYKDIYNKDKERYENAMKTYVPPDGVQPKKKP